jgi:hypothetical protein
MGILSRIVPLVALGLGVIFVGNALIRPKDAGATVDVFEEGGSAIGSSLGKIGSGAAGLGEGVGTGLAGLLKPFWEIKNLITAVPVFDASVAGSANASAVAQSQGETSVSGNTSPRSSTITWSSGTTRNVPTLSAAAKSYYSSRGVSVS